MLATVREFALEPLAESGDEEATRRAHAAYFLRLAAEARAGIEGVEQQVWLSRLTPELDNLRSALEWSWQRREPAMDELVSDALDAV
jgi:predicted ATPase